MENYKPNSFKYKNEQRIANNEEKKTPQKVVNSQVNVQKKSGFRKFLSTIFTDNIPKFKEHMWMDIVIPSIKKAISDATKTAIDVFVYGDDPRRNSNVPGNRVSYTSYYSKPNTTTVSSNRPSGTRNGFDYDCIEFTDRGDAEVVLDSLMDLIKQYGHATVADLYDLAGVSTTNYLYNDYGWRDLHTARVVLSYGKYILQLPRVEPIR